MMRKTTNAGRCKTYRQKSKAKYQKKKEKKNKWINKKHDNLRKKHVQVILKATNSEAYHLKKKQEEKVQSNLPPSHTRSLSTNVQGTMQWIE